MSSRQPAPFVALGLLTLGELGLLQRILFTDPREYGFVLELVGGGAAIALLRDARYIGRPELAGQVFETATPVVENHLHVSHNLHQLLYADWTHARRFVVTTFFIALIGLVTSIFRSKDVRASVWSLVFLSTVIAFGYVNETRHYLPLLSFWAVYWAARKYALVEHPSLPA